MGLKRWHAGIVVARGAEEGCNRRGEGGEGGGDGGEKVRENCEMRVRARDFLRWSSVNGSVARD